MTLLTCDK